MTLTVETGAGLSNAEAYISVTDADAHHSGRGMTDWATLSTSEKEQALRRAADYMSQTYRLRWLGWRVLKTQAMDWPRFNVPFPDMGSTSYYPSDAVPQEVKWANAELAFRGAAGPLLDDLSPPTSSESVGPISVSYQAGGAQSMRYPAIDRLLAPMLESAGRIKLSRS